jgi:hypothetical protein
MDNPESLATLATPDTGHQKDDQHGPHHKPGMNSLPKYLISNGAETTFSLGPERPGLNRLGAGTT